MSDQKIMAEYIWLDGRKPTAKLRSKTKVINGPVRAVADIPLWGFDGSSTEQAEGHFSDCMLKPVSFVTDPINKAPNILVMCEVLNPDGTPHPSNTRHVLAAVAEKYKAHEPLFGIEQEYTLYRKDWPFGGSAFESVPGSRHCHLRHQCRRYAGAVGIPSGDAGAIGGERPALAGAVALVPFGRGFRSLCQA